MALRASNPGFKIGDSLTSLIQPDPYTVIDVEQEHDPSLQTNLDMGRYTVRASDGSVYRNMPGYLFRRVMVERREDAA